MEAWQLDVPELKRKNKLFVLYDDQSSIPLGQLRTHCRDIFMFRDPIVGGYYPVSGMDGAQRTLHHAPEQEGCVSFLLRGGSALCRGLGDWGEGLDLPF